MKKQKRRVYPVHRGRASRSVPAHGRLFPFHRGLDPVLVSGCGGGPGSPGHGSEQRTTTPDRVHSPFGPRGARHGPDLPGCLAAQRPAAQHGSGGQRVGQCPGGTAHRHVEGRIRHRRPLPFGAGGPSGGSRSRYPVQSKTSAFESVVCYTTSYSFYVAAVGGSKCQPIAGRHKHCEPPTAQAHLPEGSVWRTKPCPVPNAGRFLAC